MKKPFLFALVLSVVSPVMGGLFDNKPIESVSGKHELTEGAKLYEEANRIYELSNPYNDADTLQFFLSKSTSVVIATARVIGIADGSGPIHEPNVIKAQPEDMITDISIERVLYGTAPDEKDVTIDVYRVGAQNGVSGIRLENNKRYIFFLKRCDSPYTTHLKENFVQWQTVDVWFGVYPFDTALAEKLKKLEWERFKKQYSLYGFLDEGLKKLEWDRYQQLPPGKPRKLEWERFKKEYLTGSLESSEALK